MSVGRLIVVEGVDGSGKTTLSKGLAEVLKVKGFEVVSTREPGGTPLAEELRTFLFSEEGAKLSLQEQMELVHKGRMNHIEEVIVPALEAGKTVISDRFEMSTLVYQVWHDTEKLKPVYEKLENEILHALNGETPEYLFLVLPPEIVKERQMKSNEINRFDAVDIEPIMERLAAYEYAAENVRGNIHVLDAAVSPEAVLEQALKALKIS